jgi:hypothetical protein
VTFVSLEIQRLICGHIYRIYGINFTSDKNLAVMICNLLHHFFKYDDAADDIVHAFLEEKQGQNK